MCASAALRRPLTIAPLETLIAMLNIQGSDTVILYITVKFNLYYHYSVEDLEVGIYRILPVDG